MSNLSLQIDLQSDFLKEINETPEQFSKDIKFWAAVSLYFFGKVNITTASIFAGYNYSEFIAQLENLKIPINHSNHLIIKSNNQTPKKSKRYFGCGKHIIKSISDDFTQPLPQFKEYMP